MGGTGNENYRGMSVMANAAAADLEEDDAAGMLEFPFAARSRDRWQPGRRWATASFLSLCAVATLWMVCGGDSSVVGIQPRTADNAAPAGVLELAQAPPTEAALQVGKKVNITGRGPYHGHVGTLVAVDEVGDPEVRMDDGDIIVFYRSDISIVNEASSENVYRVAVVGASVCPSGFSKLTEAQCRIAAGALRFAWNHVHDRSDRPGGCWKANGADKVNFNQNVGRPGFGSQICIKSQPIDDYTVFRQKNAYNKHGAMEIDDDPMPGLTESECAKSCSDYPSCVCFTFRSDDTGYSKRGDCWKRSSCNPAHFESNAATNSFSVFVKKTQQQQRRSSSSVAAAAASQQQQRRSSSSVAAAAAASQQQQRRSSSSVAAAAAVTASRSAATADPIDDYTVFRQKNAYNKHGAMAIDDDPMPGLTESACAKSCSDYPSCVCFTFRSDDTGYSKQGDCWKRSSCNPAHFESNAATNSFSVFVKKNRDPPPAAGAVATLTGTIE